METPTGFVETANHPKYYWCHPQCKEDICRYLHSTSIVPMLFLPWTIIRVSWWHRNSASLPFPPPPKKQSNTPRSKRSSFWLSRSGRYLDEVFVHGFTSAPDLERDGGVRERGVEKEGKWECRRGARGGIYPYEIGGVRWVKEKNKKSEDLFQSSR